MNTHKGKVSRPNFKRISISDNIDRCLYEYENKYNLTEKELAEYRQQVEWEET